MDAIIAFFNSLDFDFMNLLKIGLVLLLGTFLISVIGRFAFGKRSVLNNAVSSAIGILFIYAVTVVLKSFGAQFEALIFVKVLQNYNFYLYCKKTLAYLQKMS